MLFLIFIYLKQSFKNNFPSKLEFGWEEYITFISALICVTCG